MPGYVEPYRAVWREFDSGADSGPIHMLNLVALKGRAIYPVGHPDHAANRTGKDAYRIYSDAVVPILQRFGARQVWAAVPELTVIGPTDRERWDIAFVVEYPSGAAFMAMMRDPQYRLAVLHRTAAVEDSRLVRLRPGDPSHGLGG
jgi:uncharacterized protein (DUF1330 family)